MAVWPERKPGDKHQTFPPKETSQSHARGSYQTLLLSTIYDGK